MPPVRTASSGSAADSSGATAMRSEGTSMPAPGELKPQKACVGCRRSKVRCEHDGGPPCRRCKESGQECKFRLRADDERWRERTDEMLSRLSQAVETLVSRGGDAGQTPPSSTGGPSAASTSYQPYPFPPPSSTRSSSTVLPSAAEQSGGAGSAPFSGGPGPSTFNAPRSLITGVSPSGSAILTGSPAEIPYAAGHPGPSTPSDRSGGAHASRIGRSPGPYAFGPLHSLTGPRVGEDARMHDGNGSAAAATRSGPVGGAPGGSGSHFGTSHGRGSSSASASSSLAMLPPPLPSSLNATHPSGLPPGTGTGTPFPQRLSTSTTLPMPPALIPGLRTVISAPATSSSPGLVNISAPAPLPIDPDQTLPSTLILQLGVEAAALAAAASGGSSGANAGAGLLGNPYDGGGGVGGNGSGVAATTGLETRVRWQVGPPSPYASPAVHLGRDDPRLNAMSLGLVPMEKARSLFVFFSEWLQPHCFGFPTYAASEQMTPLIISCILAVASLLDPTAQTAAHHHALLEDALNVIKVDQIIDGPDMPLNPELGIGVEEITGAAIFSAWMGGELAWKIARVTRFWAVAYLRHFELPSRNVTLGECLTILPPFRQIDLCDKLRIWLTAYVAEAQQSFLFDRASLAPDQTPQAYCHALRAAFRDTEPAFAVPPADRQLIAHAGILFILVEAQTIQRERRWERDAKMQLAAEFQRQHHKHQQRHGHTPNGNGSDGSGSTMDVSRSGPEQYPPPPQPPTLAQEVAQGLRNLVAFGREWIEDVERWMVAARKLEDLSSCTGISLDITLMYHLARAWLCSSALEASRVLNSMTTAHGDESRAIAQGLDSLFDVVEHQVIRSAKDGAYRALQLATSRTEGFADRLAYLPTIYHSLLNHAASFLLLLVQRHRRWRYLVGGELTEVLKCAEDFVQTYTYAIQAHGVNNEEHPQVRHPSRAMCQALMRALQQAKASV